MMSRRAARFRAGAPMLAVIVVTGAAVYAGLDVQSHRTLSYGAGADLGPDSITTVVIANPAGNVQVTGGASALDVTERQSYRTMPPTSSHTVSDGTMTLGYHCATNDCGIDYDVQVPDGVAVQITDSAGNVILTKLNAGVQVSAGAGNITASGMSGGPARFTSDAGYVLVGFAGAPVSVYAESEAGDVTLFLPGSASYKVAASSQAGAVHVTVPLSNGAADTSTVTAKSDAGDVAVRTQM
jgi:Putative adhesin